MKATEAFSNTAAIENIPGISTVRKKSFAQLGITDIGSLVDHFPRAYQNRGNVYALADAPLDTPVSLILTVGTDPKSVKIRGNLSLTKFKAFDNSASCEIIFYNRTYADKSYPRGSVHRFYGKLTRTRGGFALSSPESEPCYEGAELLPILPVYPLATGLTQKLLRTSLRYALDGLYPVCVDGLGEIRTADKDPIPAYIRKKYKLSTKEFAVKNIHFPESEEALRDAGERLAFEELFLLSVKLSYTKKAQKEKNAPVMAETELGDFLKCLDYELTGAQKKVIAAIQSDMSKPTPMNRLVSGDVGSGKTVCAAAGAYIAVKNGCQSAMMAPTEILARQHFADLSKMFSRLGYTCALLIGGTKAAEKKKILDGLKSGEIDFVIGTHALIGDKVEFANAGLVITDEQHRFGVRQRAALSEKTKGVHVLVMSATPIPRTLALILYGDLDVSQIDEMPPGRQKVDTFVVGEPYRERLNAFIRKQVDAGGRVYIVCPTVEEAKPDEDEADLNFEDIFGLFEKEEKSELKSTLEYARKLREEIFPDIGVGYIHGKMKSGEKEAAMSAFASGETPILVSTTVIEVGVNVPEATLMVVENAERFGLSQLHQLRGRVGRGKNKSYCVLVSDAKAGSASQKRLDVMKNKTNGYEIAEEDLKQRGPGDFISTSAEMRQHGKLKLKLAQYTSATLMMNASAAASEVITLDPELEKAENAGLRHALGELDLARSGTLN